MHADPMKVFLTLKPSSSLINCYAEALVFAFSPGKSISLKIFMEENDSSNNN